MATCLSCGKDYTRPPGDLGSYCPACDEASTSLGTELEATPAVKPILTAPSPAPALTYLLIAANVAIFILMEFKGSPFPRYRLGDTQFLIRWGAQFGPLFVSGDWWRIFTAMFLHADVSHIFLNMIYLWYFGKQIEPVGRLRFLAVYFLSGAAGFLASFFWDPMVVSVGASGAIFGLLGALTAPRNLNKRNIGPIIAFIAIMILPGTLQSHVDYIGHLGGIITGLILGFTLHPPQADKPAKSAWSFAAASIVVFLALVAGSAVAKSRYAYLSDLYQGERLYTQKKYAEAVPFIERSVKLQPGNASVNGLLGAALFYGGRRADSIPYLQKAAELDPKETDWWNHLGWALLDTGKNADAIAALSHVIPTKAADAGLFYNLGLAHANLGNHPKAVEFLKKSLELNPNDSQANAVLGRLFFEDSNLEEAVKYLYDAVNADPSNLAAQRNLGVAYMRRNQFDYAADCFEQALKLSKGEERDAQSLNAARAALQRSH